MSVTTYTMLEGRSVDELNTAVAAAIAAGKQPYGQPFHRVSPHGDNMICQAMIEGSQVLVAGTVTDLIDVDATMAADSDALVASQKATKTALATKPTAALDTDATMAANSDVKVASQKAVKTALALKAPLAAPTFTGTATIGSGGLKLPTADPLVAGAWWDNAGTLTKSAG